MNNAFRARSGLVAAREAYDAVPDHDRDEEQEGLQRWAEVLMESADYAVKTMVATSEAVIDTG